MISCGFSGLFIVFLLSIFILLYFPPPLSLTPFPICPFRSLYPAVPPHPLPLQKKKFVINISMPGQKVCMTRQRNCNNQMISKKNKVEAPHSLSSWLPTKLEHWSVSLRNGDRQIHATDWVYTYLFLSKMVSQLIDNF